MKIKEILRQDRRDFTAIYVCAHCDNEEESYGYDDTNFHVNVIPNMVCKNCGKKSDPLDYKPRATKYSDSETV